MQIAFDLGVVTYRVKEFIKVKEAWGFGCFLYRC
jgi:hypothetical protein